MSLKGLKIDTKQPVMVTGATGYIAGWLVKDLLEAGVDVHATVRDPNNTAKLAHLDAVAAKSKGKITYFAADLTGNDGFDAAMAGCGIVIHTASPFISKIKDAQRDLIDPALMGTRSVLEAANRTDTVTRVVLTSSCAAIFGDVVDCAKAPGGVLTEEHWNITSSITHQAYSYSKTLAERAAWEIADAQDRWKLVVINPSLVIGPALSGAPTSASFDYVKQLCDGTMKMGAPAFEIGAVDVRDVAEAHIRAAFIGAAEGRHITSAENRTFLGLADELRKTYGDKLPLPRKELPTWLAWLVGPILDKSLSRKAIARNFGHKWQADNSKSKTALGMDYRPLDIAISEMVAQMIDKGVLKTA